MICFGLSGFLRWVEFVVDLCSELMLQILALSCCSPKWERMSFTCLTMSVLSDSMAGRGFAHNPCPSTELFLLASLSEVCLCKRPLHPHPPNLLSSEGWTYRYGYDFVILHSLLLFQRTVLSSSQYEFPKISHAHVYDLKEFLHTQIHTFKGYINGRVSLVGYPGCRRCQERY